ncbi:hypothetical protein [Parasphingopyxis sp.]|uniref:hypothetical protein n=1 Tax=Parasphingopyxis sp. TaxID=1920299 RepID=UPI0026133B17|nr:hypothetical protein [Parasphingopyxis sp.]
MNRLIAALCVSALLAVAPAGAQKPDSGQTPREEMDELLRSLGEPPHPSGAALDRLIADADARPLGSRENPVRADMPQGQRAYLDRLRCENGLPPRYNRAGNFGPGPFGSIIDGYEVACPNSAPETMMIFMDMYHSGYRETATVPGFAITE